MHGFCIGREYEQQNMKNYMKILVMCHAGSRHLQCGLKTGISRDSLSRYFVSSCDKTICPYKVSKQRQFVNNELCMDATSGKKGQCSLECCIREEWVKQSPCPLRASSSSTILSCRLPFSSSNSAT